MASAFGAIGQARSVWFVICLIVSATLFSSAHRQGASLATQLIVLVPPLLVGVPALRRFWRVGLHWVSILVASAISWLAAFLNLGARDAAFAAIAVSWVGAVVIVTRQFKRSTGAGVSAAALGLSAVWFGWSVAERSATFSMRSPALKRPPSKNAFGLALSGGGFRAAVFHAGVLDEMESRDLRPEAISAVSGGAIIGAFYATGGKPREFVDRVWRGQFNIGREALTTYSLPRLILATKIPGLDMQFWPVDFSRTKLLSEQLDRSFMEGGTIAEVETPLLVGLTDARAGTAIGVWQHGIIEIPVRSSSISERQTTCSPRGSTDLDLGKLAAGKLSLLVAVSGSFPLAFDGVSTPIRHLVDGGVLDNSAVGLFVCAGETVGAAGESTWSPFAVQRLVASDASALSEEQESLMDWVEAIHRATGPSSIAAESQLRRKNIEWVSASRLIRPRRAHESLETQTKLYFETGSYLRSNLLECLSGHCRNGWTLNDDDFDKLVSFLEDDHKREDVKRALAYLRHQPIERPLTKPCEAASSDVSATKYFDRFDSERCICNALAEQFELMAETFRSTPTLSSQFDQRTVLRLYNFGRLAYMLKGMNPLTVAEFERSQEEHAKALAVQLAREDKARAERLGPAVIASYRRRLVGGPTLEFPPTEELSTRLSITTKLGDPVTLGNHGIVYPTGTFVSRWGTLHVDDVGALMSPDGKSLRVVAPADTEARPLVGPGWRLELAPGWTIRAAAKAGSFRLAPE